MTSIIVRHDSSFEMLSCKGRFHLLGYVKGFPGVPLLFQPMVQLIGKAFGEEDLFRTAAVIEKAAGRFSPQKWW